MILILCIDVSCSIYRIKTSAVNKHYLSLRSPMWKIEKQKVLRTNGSETADPTALFLLPVKSIRKIRDTSKG